MKFYDILSASIVIFALIFAGYVLVDQTNITKHHHQQQQIKN